MKKKISNNQTNYNSCVSFLSFFFLYREKEFFTSKRQKYNNNYIRRKNKQHHKSFCSRPTKNEQCFTYTNSETERDANVDF